jgi:O-antigen biosynthesis protein
MQLREKLKRSLPKSILAPLQSLRRRMAAPPLEETVLHRYEMLPEVGRNPRLTLVIPSIAPEKTFGGIITGIDIFLELGKRTNADLRILLDEIGPVPAGNSIASRARMLGVDVNRIEILPRLTETPRIAVRSTDVFLSYNWWTTLNVQDLILQQSRYFGGPPKPTLYLIQEYEPFFHPFSSTHMMARQAFAPPLPCWGIFNSGELYAYFCAQGHQMERSFVFEPQLNSSLKALLERGPCSKDRRLLVYGRPAVARNCYPAVVKGVRAWAIRYPEFSNWEVLSAGLAHPPIVVAPGRVMKSAGKLAMEQYGELLLTSAAGLSLMSSPHPSYPPLEMAHFGLWTVTNDYTNKDLTKSHQNIISVDNIAPDTVADALAQACRNFESDPDRGWRGKTLRPSFLESKPFEFLDQISADLKASAWQ